MPQRTIKLVRPVCPQRICQEAGHGWWDTCPHDPYYHVAMTMVEEPILEPDPADPNTMLVTGMNRKQVYDRAPNVMEVVSDVSVNSGNGPQQTVVLKGFKPLPDLGFAPVCELSGCFRSDITIRIREGNFCCKEHARFVKGTMGHPEKAAVVPVEPERRREFFESIPI